MKYIIPLAIAALLGACASEPSLQTGPDAEVTFDGLNRVNNSAFRDAWADPDADWARYDKIMPGGAFFEFRAVKKTNRTSSAMTRSNENEFWIDDDSKAKLEATVSEIFNEELRKSQRFTATDKPGDDVLIIRGGLHDIVSNVPPEYVGRSDVYLRSVGEATLILEVIDSMSGEVLARAVERRAVERPGGQMIYSSPVTTWAEVRRMARTWATRLRDGLDNLPSE